MKHLVYIWLREKNSTFPAGTPYYVGKDSSGTRAYSSVGHIVHRPESDSSILVKDCFSEEEAFEMEKYLIALFGRIDNSTGCLRNLTDGGEGILNPSLETRIKMSIAQAKRTQSLETRAKIGAANRGHYHSLETRVKISAINRGRVCLPEHRIKISIANKNRIPWNKDKICPLETRLKMSKAAQGRTFSPEIRAKLSAANKGHIVSPETRTKISAALKDRIPTFRGRTHSLETRIKISNANKNPSEITRKRMSEAAKKNDPLYLK
jgi:hypothetical protein